MDSENMNIKAEPVEDDRVFPVKVEIMQNLFSCEAKDDAENNNNALGLAWQDDNNFETDQQKLCHDHSTSRNSTTTTSKVTSDEDLDITVNSASNGKAISDGDKIPKPTAKQKETDLKCDNCSQTSFSDEMNFTKRAINFNKKDKASDAEDLENSINAKLKVQSQDCLICHKKFKTDITLKVHMRLHSKETSYHCHICDRTFCQMSHLTEHIRTHTKEKPFKCKFCGGSFSKKSTLTRHMSTHVNEKPFKCEFCDKTFSIYLKLTQHTRAHAREIPNKCEFCHKIFQMRSNLRQHLRTHTNEKPFQCEFCEKSFSRNTYLTEHVRTHTGEKPFKCHFCDKSFPQRSALNRHMRNHTKGKTSHRNVVGKPLQLDKTPRMDA